MLVRGEWGRGREGRLSLASRVELVAVGTAEAQILKLIPEKGKEGGVDLHVYTARI